MFSGLLIILLLTQKMLAQSPIVFHYEGDVKVFRKSVNMLNRTGITIESGDTIHLIDGLITFINKDLKRLSLERPAYYTFSEIIAGLDKADASFANKYLYLVWERMTSESNSSTHPGGVVRANVFSSWPPDSAIILIDNLVFRFENPDKQHLELVFYDQHRREIDRFITSDSLFYMNGNEIIWWKEGLKAFWEIEMPFIRPLGPFYFSVSENIERHAIKHELDQLIKEFSLFPLPIQQLIFHEVILEKKWIGIEQLVDLKIFSSNNTD